MTSHISKKNSGNLSYRPEVDGLRAFAVIAVILYHAQFVIFNNDWFKGGYIGVDIFFVISGYLIARIILKELWATGSFNFMRFYEKRARRILPTLLLVILVSLPFAAHILSPSAFVEFAGSVIASILFFANFFFYFSTTEYGAESSLMKPFLHAWSLGVEEQFYLIFPVIAIAIFKFTRAFFLPIILFLIFGSLVFSEVMASKNPDLNFYLPFSRFWEIAFGSVLAYIELNYDSEESPSKVKHYWTKALPIAGLCLLVYSVFTFNAETRHPGMQTLFPVVGVALVIRYASSNDIVGKILGFRPLVAIGLTSYSAYLWHFPIFAFARHLVVSPGNLDKIIWVVVTAALSLFSYYLIEGPFRKKSVISSKWFAIIIGTVTLFLLLGATLVIKNDGYKKRFDKLAGFENYNSDKAELRRLSWTVLENRNKTKPEFFDVPNKVLVVGNSHGKDIFNSLYLNIEKYSGFDFKRDGTSIKCFNPSIPQYQSVREKFYNSRSYKNATLIIISTRYGEGPCNIRNKSQIKASEFSGLVPFIQRAKQDGKQIIVMGNTVEFDQLDKQWVADFIYDTQVKSSPDETDLNFREIKSDADHLLYEQINWNVFENNEKIRETAESENVGYYEKFPLICSEERKTCDAFTDEGFKTLYDYGHYTIEGARLFGSRLANDKNFLKLLPKD